MSDRPYGRGRATLNREAESLASQCSALAVSLAVYNPRDAALGLLSGAAREATLMMAERRVRAARWWLRALWWVLRPGRWGK